MFDQGQLGSGMQLPNVYLIHEGADEEDAPPRAAQEVLRGQGVWKRLQIEALALVGKGKDQLFAGVLETGRDLLGGVVLVAVQDGVVTLEGAVPNEPVRLRALGVARGADGVKDVVDKLYAEYGDGPPSGMGPDQGRAQMEGNAYLAKEFPKMDYIKKATIVEKGAAKKPAAKS